MPVLFWQNAVRQTAVSANIRLANLPGTILHTVETYNASAVKIYNAASSIGRFKSKNIFSYFEKTL
jgi:hypothetical protein